MTRSCSREWKKVSRRLPVVGAQSQISRESKRLLALWYPLKSVQRAKKNAVSGELGAQVSWQRKEIEKHEKKTEEYLEKKESWKISQQSECRIVAWQIVDKYTLYNYDEERVSEWAVYNDRIAWAMFPEQH